MWRNDVMKKEYRANNLSERQPDQRVQYPGTATANVADPPGQNTGTAIALDRGESSSKGNSADPPGQIIGKSNSESDRGQNTGTVVVESPAESDSGGYEDDFHEEACPVVKGSDPTHHDNSTPVSTQPMPEGEDTGYQVNPLDTIQIYPPNN